MLTSNVDVSDRLFNGAVGELKYIESDENEKLIRLWFDFYNISVGEKARRTNKIWLIQNTFCCILKINEDWTPIGLTMQR